MIWTNYDVLTANPLVVVSIENTVLPQHYACTFAGAEGTNTTVVGSADVVPPQAQLSVHCDGLTYIP